ncbi:MAG: hypothetical protein RJQ09_01500 [Cyclobacteriaceae bacterium]
MEDFVPYLVFIAMTITFWFVTLKATTKSPKHGSIISTIVFALIVGFMMIFASIQASEATKQAALAEEQRLRGIEYASQAEEQRQIAQELAELAESTAAEARRQQRLAAEAIADYKKNKR